ncbi:diacylglycerol kinase family protein [Paenibacillus chitinolyticus]|uniref:diacylglycerol kinase family protein n=1 Tax=Paenibacillus TaxID=44249 RepID=UPI001C309A47|nr:diacylglycerol kinase family protein [Paenibacillus sp. GbtcB18]
MSSFQRFLRGFRFAYEGIKYAFDTQRNMKFHFVVAFLVFLAAVILGLPHWDVLFLLLAVVLVIMTELINTAVEKAVDLAMPELHPLAKIAKDTAAGAVLVAALFAVVVGMVVFYGPADRLLRKAQEAAAANMPGMVWTLIALVALVTIVIETRFSDRGKLVRPSLLAAVLAALATLIAVIAGQTIVTLLSGTLAALALMVLAERKHRELSSLLLGSVIGAAVTLLAWLWRGWG